ncbi:hypothetical protein ARMSODRAFT_471631 [Armillaria solidipes]|uniref:DUF6533 domain-containing protein n=1 Tax=Armillaria solidipes TaxID=1076256 RepID=A0A2H3B0I4_9AGAR|nr:hypothetical protein ARMSODRAFT_471631 [Armillaria solidipes]
MDDDVPLLLQLGVDWHYTFYAEKTVLLWEYLVTVYDEVDLFWSSKLSWIKCLFFVNRYLIIALRIWDIIGYLCILVLNPDSALYATIQVMVMESILILRVWAIVGRKKNVLVSFSILLFLNVAATLGIYFAMPTSTLTFYYWLPMILFELIMFLTAAVYGVRGMKATKFLTQMRQNFGPKPITGLLLRDSVFYFLIVLCCIPILAFVNNEIGLSLMSMTITRMLLRLRKRAKVDMPRSQDMELESFRVANPVELGVSIAPDA